MNQPTLPPRAKFIFTSKSALAGAITALGGVIGTIRPDASAWIAANANNILIVLGLLGIIIRKITSGRVVLFPDKLQP